MNIQFDRRKDLQDAMGRCPVHLRAYFDGQRLRYATREKCTEAHWDATKGRFKKAFPGYQEANEYLEMLTSRLQARYRMLRANGLSPTPVLLKEVFGEPTGDIVTAAPQAPALPLLGLYADYLETLQARGMMAQSLVSARNTLTHLTEFQATTRRKLLLHEYTVMVHDKFLGHLRQVRKLAPNTVAKSVKHLKAFLRYLRDDRKLMLALELRQLKVQWAEVDKVYLTAVELALLEAVELPENLAATRDGFLFCCYTGLRHSDLHELNVANVREWDGSRVLRLTQTKTRTAVSIYLTPPAAALLDKYAGTRAGLLPAYTNQAMNRNLKEICQLAGLRSKVEVVTVEQGQVVKRSFAKYRLVTMHTARHTFAVQSLMRGLSVAVLQKVMGHAKIQTTMIYAKIVEDFQHQEMRRVWEGGGNVGGTPTPLTNPQVCMVKMAA